MTPYPTRRALVLSSLTLGAGTIASRSAAFQEAAAAGERVGDPERADPVLQAVEKPGRMPFDRRRDATRKPRRILDFFDLKPGMQVADIQAGNGYYTELMSDVVGRSGRVYCVNDSVTQRLYGEQLTQRLERQEFDDSQVVRKDVPLTEMGLPEGGLDLVLLVRFYHDFGWMELDRARFNRDVFKALAPGGAFGVIDHHAKTGRGIADGGSLHRIEASLVLEELEAAGFVLESESYVLRDPTDGRDFNIFENNQARRDRTDRFVFLFRKPQ